MLKRISAFFRRMKDWYVHPDQSLTRMEVRWICRWFFRYPGYFLLPIYLVVTGFATYEAEVKNLLGISAITPKWILHLPLFMKTGFWIYFIRARIEPVFRKERFDELIVTLCDGKLLWPALLWGPAIGVAVISAADWILLILPPSLVSYLGGGEFVVWKIMKLPFELTAQLSICAVIVLIHLGFTISITAYAVSESLPQLNPVRLVWRGFLGLMIVFTPGMLPLTLIMLGWMRSATYGSSGAPAPMSVILVAALLFYILDLCMIFYLYRRSIRKLQTGLPLRSMWESVNRYRR